MAKRVPWDGPNPLVGEYLATNKPDRVLRIHAVSPIRRAADGARLALEVRVETRKAMPKGAVVYPVHRYAPSDPKGPPRVRQVIAGSPASVLQGRWRDPEDNRPNAVQRPRQICGWRGFCSLRRMHQVRNSQITERHIAAADHLRTLYDLDTIGASAPPDTGGIQSGYGPRAGPSQAAVTQAAAAIDLQRCWARFALSHHAMVKDVILRNRSIYAWCGEQGAKRADGKPLDQKLEMGKLIAILDILEDHFRTVVDERMLNAN